MICKKENKTKGIVFWLVLSLVFMLPTSMRSQVASDWGITIMYIAAIGLLIYGCKHRIVIRKGVLAFWGLTCIWLGISVFNSIIYHQKFGTINGIDTFQAILGSSYFHVVNAVAVMVYVYYINRREDSMGAICHALDLIANIEIAMGVLQLAVVFHVPGALQIYNLLNAGNWLFPGEYIAGTGRISMTASEPASGGAKILLLLLPYLWVRYRHTQDKKILFKIIILLVFAYFTKSTTTYVLVAVMVATVGVRYILRKHNKVNIKVVAGCMVASMILCTALFVAGINASSFENAGNTSELKDEIKYILFEKVFDKSNMSTMHRMSANVNDIKIIAKHPFLGVGDGNQGFYYKEHLPSYMLINPKTQAWANGEVVVNGGPYLLAVISGFGIFGVLLFLLWVLVYYVPEWKKMNKINRFCSEWLAISLPSIIIVLLNGSMEMNLIFLLVMPFWAQPDLSTAKRT